MERTGINQDPYGGSVYPFIADGALVPLFVDFYLAYEDPQCQFVRPFRLFQLSGFGDEPASLPGFLTPLHARDLIVVDLNDEVVFDSTVAGTDYQESAWGSDRVICQWQTETGIARAVIFTDEPYNFATEIEPVAAIVDDRTLLQMPGRVRSFVVNGVKYTGNFVFQAGYNVATEVTVPDRVDGSRVVSRIAFDGVPGAGDGQLPGCEDTVPVLRRINQISPLNGQFTIETDPCLRWQVPGTIEEDVDGSRTFVGSTSGFAEISDDCLPCEDCSFYARVYKGLTRVWNRWLAAATVLEQTRNTYVLVRQRWLDQAACRADRALQLTALGETSCKVFIGGTYCNMTECCLQNVEMRVTLERFTDGGAAALGTVESVLNFVSLGDGEQETAVERLDQGSVFSNFFDTQDRQATASFRSRLCLQCDATTSLRITLSVHIADTEGCDLPTPEAPDGLPAIWTAAGAANTTLRAFAVKTVGLNPLPATYPCDC